MTRNHLEWCYLIDGSGRHWHRFGSGSRSGGGGGQPERPPSHAVYAISSRDLISHPHWISSKDPEIISRVVTAESEKLGVKPNSGPGKVTGWSPVEYNGSSILVQSFAIPWDLEGLAAGPTEFAAFVPRHSLYAPPEDALVLWREDGELVAGYARGRRWVHVQPLGRISDEAVEGEIQLTLMELTARGVVQRIQRIVVWGSPDDALSRSLSETTGLPVEFAPHPDPALPKESGWELVPHEISRRRLAASHRRRILLFALGAFFIMLVAAAAAASHLSLLEQGNERLRDRIAAHRDSADMVSAAMDRWDALSPAIEVRRSVLELFHQVSSLLPERGLRLTSFEVQDHDTLIIRGEAASMANALQIKGALENAAELSDYEWEIPPPRQRDDLTEFYASGTYRF